MGKRIDVKVERGVLALTGLKHDVVVALVRDILEREKIPLSSIMKVMTENKKILICTTIKIIECDKHFNNVKKWQGYPVGHTVGSNCYGHFLRALS